VLRLWLHLNDAASAPQHWLIPLKGWRGEGAGEYNVNSFFAKIRKISFQPY
jgi:hypothetical protein